MFAGDKLVFNGREMNDWYERCCSATGITYIFLRIALQLTLKKTVAISFGRQPIEHLQINGTSVQLTTSCKYLGVLVNTP